MPYTIGASHGPFTGTGSFTIAKPAGIRTVVTNIPSWTGHENENPRRYFRLGRFTLGNTQGFSQSLSLEYAQQLAYPLPAIWDLLAYDINDGASCLFQELVEVPDLTLKQPWDRTPLTVQVGGGLYIPGPTALMTNYTYTVPIGRRLYLSSARARITRVAAASASGATEVFVRNSSVPFVYAYAGYNIVGAVSLDEMNGGPLILNAGTVVDIQSRTTDTGGSWSGNAMFNGFLFDA